LFSKLLKKNDFKHKKTSSETKVQNPLYVVFGDVPSIKRER